jgi:3-keto-5-aminohexanoate cleavage enzyme
MLVGAAALVASAWAWTVPTAPRSSRGAPSTPARAHLATPARARLEALAMGADEAPRPSALTKDHGKLVITLATTGNINTKEKNPNLPCSPQEMADDMHECIKLGASVLHIHSRDEHNKPTMRLDVFRETCRLVKERDPDVILQISTGGRAGGGHEWRIDQLNLLPEMGSYTPGSVNLGPIVYQNDARLVQDLAQKYHDTGIKPQIEVFDTNMISNADLLVKQGLLKRPLDFGLVMGAPGAQECSMRQLGHLISMLQPGDTWTSIGIGKYEMPLAYMAIAMGGHVRVGLEDNNKTPEGKLATNYDLGGCTSDHRTRRDRAAVPAQVVRRCRVTRGVRCVPQSSTSSMWPRRWAARSPRRPRRARSCRCPRRSTASPRRTASWRSSTRRCRWSRSSPIPCSRRTRTTRRTGATPTRCCSSPRWPSPPDEIAAARAWRRGR